MEIGNLLKKNIQFEEQRCFLYRNSNVRCGRCLEVCPVKAIQLNEGRIHFQETNCENCGACRAACPTEAFTLNRLNFLAEICSSTGEEVFLGCTLNKENQSDFNISCHAMLTEGELAYLLAKKKRIGFKTRHCENCRYGRGVNSFLGYVGLINGIMKDNDRIFLSSGEAGSKGIDRRGFFSWLQRRLLTAVGDIIPAGANEPDAGIPKRRHTLLLGLRYLHDELKEHLFIREMNVQNSCTGCGGCVKVCPCKALAFENETLSWQAKLCLNCGLCMATCPEKALFLGKHVTREEFFRSKVLREFPGRRCRLCGVFLTEDEAICESCEGKKSLDLLS